MSDTIDPTEFSVHDAVAAANAVHADAKRRPLIDSEKAALQEAAKLLEDAARD